MPATILAIGLLLLVAGFGSARIPGGATFARPGIGRSPGIAFNPIRAFILSPVHPSTWYANASILIGFFVAIVGFAVVAGLTAAGISTLVALIGVVILVAAVEASRIVARVERSRTFLGERVQPLPHPYRAFGDWPFGVLRDELLDESRWRDVLYVLVNLPLAVIEFAVVLTAWAIALAIVTMPVWYDAAPGAVGPNVLGPLEAHDPAIIVLRTALGFGLLALAASLSQVVISLHRSVVVGLLCAPESRELERQVETLRRSRSAVLDSEATELGRIERDLHDGAQQRLVMLSIDLGLANEKIDADPGAAKQLIADSQEQARTALAEIRSLVRGIAPSILLDRGLRAALESITGRGAVTTTLVTNLAPGERLPASTERAAYFVVTEALANVAKHSRATRCEIRCRREPGRLVVEVEDDGAGSAAITPGGGIEGLANRVAGVDGSFRVSSPVGGPTVVRAEIPISAW